MPVDVLASLARGLNRRDEVPNVELAEALIAKPEARDRAVRILAMPGADKKHARKAVPALLAQVRAAPVTQLPMYTGLALPVIGAARRTRFLETLHARLREPLPPAMQRRLGSVLRKVERLAQAGSGNTPRVDVGYACAFA